MSIGALITSPILKSALELVLPLVHDVLGGGEFADTAISNIQIKSLEIDGKRIAAQQQVLKAELEGNWIQRNWRPCAMFVFMFILVFHTVLVPIINALWVDKIETDKRLIMEVIDVIKWGLGGYIVSRGIEKSAKTIFEGKVKPLTQEPENGLKPRKVPIGASVTEAPFMNPSDHIDIAKK